MLDYTGKSGSVLGSLGYSALNDLYNPYDPLYSRPMPPGVGMIPVHPLYQVHHPGETLAQRFLHDPLAHLKRIDPNWGNY